MSRGRRYNFPTFNTPASKRSSSSMAEMGDFSDQMPSGNGMAVGVEQGLGENGPGLIANKMPTMGAPTAIEKIVSATSLTGWWSAAQGFVSPDFSRLHLEIVGFCKANELSAEQTKSRADALAHIESVVHEIWPKAEVHLFGSVAAGLALPWSDIDVTILPFRHGNGSWRKPSAESWLTPLSRNMDRHGQCKSMRKILAKVPLLKIVTKSGIACDISFDEKSGLQSMAIVQQYMKQYPALRPLCLVLKFFLGQQKLNELHTGGLSSFSIVIMVAAHLQKLGANAGPAGHDLGILLFSFLAYYTTFHNYRSEVVSARECPSHSKQRRRWYNAKHAERLAVEDPLDSLSNLCKGTNRSEEVRWTFRQAYGLLLVHWQQENVLSQLISPIANPNQRPGPSQVGKFQSSSPIPQREKKRPRWYREYKEGVELPLTKALQRHLQRSNGIVTGKRLEKTTSDAVESSLLDRLRIVQNESKGSGQSVQSVHSDGHCNSQEKAAVRQFFKVPQTTSIPSKKSRKRSFSNMSSVNRMEDVEESTLLEQPEQSCDLLGGSRDERTLVDFWERNLGRGPRKVPQVSTMQCADFQLVQTISQELESIGEGRMSRIPMSIERSDSTGVVDKCRSLALDVHSELSPGSATLCHEQNDFQQGDSLGAPLTASKLASWHSENDGPGEAIQAVQASQPQPGEDVVGNNDSLLVDFWEEQLSRRPKSKKRAVPHVNDTRDTFCDAADAMHHEQSPPAGDAACRVDSDLAVTPLSGSGSVSLLTDNGGQSENTLPVKTHQPQQVMDVVDGGNNEGLLVDFWEEQLIRKPKSKNRSVVPRAIGVVQVTHPEETPQGGDVGSKVQSDSLTARVGESPVTPLNVSSLQIGNGSQDEETLPRQTFTPEQEMDVVPRTTDDVLLLSFWEEQSAKKPKKRSLTQHANGVTKEDLQTAHLEQGGPLQRSPDEMMLIDFWETHLTPGLKGKKMFSKEHASKSDENSQQLQSLHLQQPQSCSVMSKKSEDEKLLNDFWVTHLAGRPKGRKISLTTEVE